MARSFYLAAEEEGGFTSHCFAKLVYMSIPSLFRHNPQMELPDYDAEKRSRIALPGIKKS